MIAELRAALGDESNFVVEQAAKVAREYSPGELIPDLVSSCHRFLNEGVDRDLLRLPTCMYLLLVGANVRRILGQVSLIHGRPANNPCTVFASG